MTRALAPTLMIQGTASSVGKSLMVAGLCRWFRDRGYRVAPFKAQNMALNAFVTPDGDEIGRAQAMQAEAAGIEPSVDMNPVLIKPEGHMRAQVIVRGRPWASLSALDYHARKRTLADVVAQSLANLRQTYDLVILEGAGSPAEINLRDQDIVNMYVAKLAQAPVLLVGDIDRGGVFAAFVGTLALLEPDERARVQGLVINKFRGDLALLEPGLAMLRERTGVDVLGVVPWLEALRVADEDSVSLDTRDTALPTAGSLEILVLRFPHISNHDDVLALEHEPDVCVRFVEDPARILEADLVILPGTKQTLADLAWLRQRGFETALRARAARQAPIYGICGGYQMLGMHLADPARVESDEVEAEGLGLLPVRTRFSPEKVTKQVHVRLEAPTFLSDGVPLPDDLRGYEIHAGHVQLEHRARTLFAPSASTHDRGCSNRTGTIVGSLVHGLLEEDRLRACLLSALRRRRGWQVQDRAPIASREAEYGRLARTLGNALDMARIESLAASWGRA